jgi:hypothetical protein
MGREILYQGGTSQPPHVNLDKAKFADAIEKCLKKKPDGQDETFHELMTVIFGRWNPNDEIGPYQLDLVFVCCAGPAADEFADVLCQKFETKLPIALSAGNVNRDRR